MAAAMVGIEWDAPAGHIKLALGDGHQATQSMAAGRSRWDPDAKMVRLVDIERFAAECVNPPPGVKSAGRSDHA
jgi:branched-chain amino acid transport system substrate-binding protein